MATKSTWGGARKGAGRPPKHEGGASVQVTAMVPEGCRRWLEQLAASEGTSLSDAVASILVRSWKRRGK